MQDPNQLSFQSAPSSSASSSRTVRAIPGTAGQSEQGQYTYTPGLYMNPAGNATTESLNTLSTLSTITPSTYGPPIPPTRTSSLAVRGRHQAGIPQSAGGLTVPPRMYAPEGHLPSVQVTHPTPTKGRRLRRRSDGQDDMTWDESPIQNTLDVRVDPMSQDAPRDRGRALPEEDEEDASEAERQSVIQEARKTRAREKGRERQRRKRERDKKAKEDARLTGAPSGGPTTALMTSTHLPIPPRNSSAASLPHPHMTPSIPQQPYPFTMSVPSSASSSYSPLPQPNFYGTLSPSTNASFASMSVSGQSSPGTLFSPAVGSSDANTMWNDGSVVMDSGKRSTREHRTTDQPPVPPIPVDLRRGKSAKRRKSEPQPDEFRDAKPPEVGLGVMIEPSWQTPSSAERPKYRRTHSEGAAVPLSASTDASRARSSTPPPLSDAPSAYMTPAETSQAGAFFATTVLVALGMSGLGKALEDQLGMGDTGLEEIKGDLAGVYDRWRLSQGLRDVTLNSGLGGQSVPMTQSLSISTEGDHEMRDDTVTVANPMGSPQRSSQAASTFFTPAPMRTTRQGVPHTMPHFGVPQMGQLQPYESPSVQLASKSHEKAQEGNGQHSRTRSLSSASMAARGLVINPGTQMSNVSQTSLPWTGEVAMHTSGSGSEGQSTSPTIQTPSTGQGSFPSAESLGMVASQNLQTNHGQMGFGQLRSATDPQQRHYVTHHPQSNMTYDQTTAIPGFQGPSGRAMTRGGGGSASASESSTDTNTSEWPPKVPSPLDSPLAMAQRARQGQSRPQASPSMPPPNMYQPYRPQRDRQDYPPPPPSFVPMSGMDSAYSTPGSQRNFRQAVPFTPPTPIHGRQPDANYSLGGMLSGNGDGMTMFYDPNVGMPGAYSDGGMMGQRRQSQGGSNNPGQGS